VWVTGNKASSRPGHLLEEQRRRWEGNPPASEPQVLIDACFHCRRGTNAALLHGELLLCASLPLEKNRECLFGPRCGGEGTAYTPARKGNPKQLLPLRRDWELGQTFHTWMIKIRLLHPYVRSHFENTAWFTSFLSCL